MMLEEYGELPMIKSIYAPLAVLVLTPTLCVAGPIIDVTPDPLDFGDVVVSSTSIVRTLTVTNIGDAVLNVNAMGPHSGSGFDYQDSYFYGLIEFTRIAMYTAFIVWFAGDVSFEKNAIVFYFHRILTKFLCVFPEFFLI